MLLDWLGSRTMNQHLLQAARAAGCDLHVYHPPSWYHLGRLNNRTHRKLLIVDGKIGFTGGVGMGIEWKDGLKGLPPWRDSHFKAEGPVVAQMQAVFVDNWIKATGRVLHGKRRLDAIGPSLLKQALEGLLGYEAARSVDRLAPIHFSSPAGSTHAIAYGAAGGPTVEVRAQALYGLREHPTVAGGRVPLTLAITSPAHRPIQTTKDLPAFWNGSWRDVAKEMRGRYPKHPWPDDPGGSSPTLKTKRASGAS